MEPTRASLKSCGVCQETMNHGNRQPVCLPLCGHSFCRFCLVRIKNVHEELKCPTCRTLHRGLTPEELPINFTLLALLEPEEEDIAEDKSKDNQIQESKSPKNDANQDKGPNKSTGDNGKGGSSHSSDVPTSGTWKKVAIGAGAVLGGVGLVAAAPLVIAGVGFTSGGIAVGSFAASMMSASAIANGGGVVAGGIVAGLQSAGAVGIGGTAATALGSAGAAVGGGLGYLGGKIFGRSSDTKNESSDQNEKTDCGDDNDGKKNGKRETDSHSKDKGDGDDSDEEKEKNDKI